jgi:D-glycero-D-manno-heptose 1,7-bisphosphate phosphatase
MTEQNPVVMRVGRVGGRLAIGMLCDMPHAAESLRPCVFLDRDDTITDTYGATKTHAVPGDMGDPALVRLLPGVPAALGALRKAGYTLVVFTSQGGVARGAYSLRQVEVVNDRVRELLVQELGEQPLEAIYYAPFHPTTGTDPVFTREHVWRKPGPGMVQAAARELGLDLSRSWAVGDKPRDVQAAVNAGLPRSRCFLLATSGEAGSDCADLPAAVGRILGGVNA